MTSNSSSRAFASSEYLRFVSSLLDRSIPPVARHNRTHPPAASRSKSPPARECPQRLLPLTTGICRQHARSRATTSFTLRLGLSARASPAWVLGPLRDITRAHPHSARDPNLSLRAVHRFSQPLDGFICARACERISSRSHVQGPSVQGLLSPRSHPPSSGGACPLAVRPVRCSPLREGCHITPASASRLLSTRGRVRCGSVIHTAAGRSPLRVPSPTGHPLPALGRSLPTTFRSRRLLTTPSPSRSYDQPALSVFSARSSAVASPPLPACSSFRAFYPTLTLRAGSIPQSIARQPDVSAASFEAPHSASAPPRARLLARAMSLPLRSNLRLCFSSTARSIARSRDVASASVEAPSSASAPPHIRFLVRVVSLRLRPRASDN
jgi:hypothetical protein